MVALRSSTCEKPPTHYSLEYSGRVAYMETRPTLDCGASLVLDPSGDPTLMCHIHTVIENISLFKIVVWFCHKICKPLVLMPFVRLSMPLSIILEPLDTNFSSPLVNNFTLPYWQVHWFTFAYVHGNLCGPRQQILAEIKDTLGNIQCIYTPQYRCGVYCCGSTMEK